MSTISPQGYIYGESPKSTNPFWGTDDNGNTPAVSNLTATASVSDTAGTPAVKVAITTEDDTTNIDFAFSGLKGEKGEQGETGATGPQGPQGETGPQGPAGKDGTGAEIDTSSFVTNVSITDENGVYGIKQTKDGTESDVGSIEVPSIDNVLAEVTDSVVETTEGNYQNDYHTIKETEHNGTQNDVGTFRIARNQITQLNSDGSYHMVDQSGNETDGQIEGYKITNINVISNHSSWYNDWKPVATPLIGLLQAEVVNNMQLAFPKVTYNIYTLTNKLTITESDKEQHTYKLTANIDSITDFKGNVWNGISENNNGIGPLPIKGQYNIITSLMSDEISEFMVGTSVGMPQIGGYVSGDEGVLGRVIYNLYKDYWGQIYLKRDSLTTNDDGTYTAVYSLGFVRLVLPYGTRNVNFSDVTLTKL